MQTQTLDQFIKQNRNTALTVIRKSNIYNVLDHDDIEEAVFCGLWKVWEKFDGSKSSLPRYIFIVVNSYIISIARRKIRIKTKEKQFDEDYSYEETNVREYFTDKQWEIVESYSHSNRSKPNAKQRVVFDKVKNKTV